MNASDREIELKTEETIFRGRMTKVSRYNWQVQDSPGVLLMMNKDDLAVDHTYQRDAKELKLLEIARSWSWIACGAIVVAERNGKFFVVDGQHRVMAARKRSDIQDLPCVVFKTHEVKQEAKGFLTAQTQRKPVTAPEKFRALVAIQDPEAMVVQELLDQAGRIATDGGKAANSVSCIAALLKWAKADAPTLRAVWPLIISVSGREPVVARLVDGLLYIAKHMPPGMSLMDKEWQRRVLKVGVKALLEGASKAASYYAHGGGKVWGNGMVEAINHGYRNRLELSQ